MENFIEVPLPSVGAVYPAQSVRWEAIKYRENALIAFVSWVHFDTLYGMVIIARRCFI